MTIRVSTLILGFVLFTSFSLGSKASLIYSVSHEGDQIDLAGYIEVFSTGTFSLTDFGDVVGDYYVRASTLESVFEFTADNSTWGGERFGSDVSVIVTSTQIELSARSGGIGLSNNVFLLADETTNRARENLRIYRNLLVFRQPNPPNSIIVQRVDSPFFFGDRAQQRHDSTCPSRVDGADLFRVDV